MNLPTKLTVTRIILSIILIILLLFPFYSIGIEFPVYLVNGISVDSRYIIAGVIFIIASFTDYLDGHIARSRNMVTNTGKMLDAIADKMLVNSVLIIFAADGRINAIVPVIVVFRDIVVNAIKMEAASRGKVIAAIKSGKLKTATQMVGMVLIFFYNFPFEFLSVNIRVDLFFIYFSTIMALVSMYQYFSMNKKLIFPEKQK